MACAAEAIRSVVPDAVEEKAEKAVREQADTSTDALKALRQYEELKNPPAAPPEPKPETK